MAVLGGLAAFWLVTRQRQKGSPAEGARALDGLDTLASWTPERSRILTAGERHAYSLLRRALPDEMVLAQVPLARFLRVPTRYSYSEWLRRVGQLCADLVVCNQHSEVIAVIEIRHPQGQESERGARRHERMDRVLSAAGISLIVWREGALPSVSAVREAVLGPHAEPLPSDSRAGRARAEPVRLAAFSGVAVGAGAAAAAPVRSIHDLEVPDAIEWPPHREPPPSTWFEDLDSAPVPLGEQKVP